MVQVGNGAAKKEITKEQQINSVFQSVCNSAILGLRFTLLDSFKEALLFVFIFCMTI